MKEQDPTGGDRGQYLHDAFMRAVQAIERAPVDPPDNADDSPADASTRRELADVRVLRSMVRDAAAAYARRLKDEGVTPERMLVLVKATTDVARPGIGVRELTNDIVRWSIEAYFAD